MTQEEQKWLSIQNEMVIRMGHKAIGMGELEKFFLFVNEVISNKNSLEQRNTEVEQKNSILKKAFIARSEQEKINLLNWEELALGLKQKVKELENNAVMYRNELLEAIEPKSCDGCIWYDELHPSYCDCLEPCVRFKHGWDKDRYEPKQTNE